MNLAAGGEFDKHFLFIIFIITQGWGVIRSQLLIESQLCDEDDDATGFLLRYFFLIIKIK